jgi:hypothetical protein
MGRGVEDDPHRPGVELPAGPPIMAVLSSADSASDWPCWAGPTAPEPTALDKPIIRHLISLR